MWLRNFSHIELLTYTSVRKESGDPRDDGFLGTIRVANGPQPGLSVLSKTWQKQASLGVFDGIQLH